MHWSSRWRDDAGDRILLVGVDRAAVEAGRVDAVVARGGDGLLHGSAGACRRSASGRPPVVTGADEQPDRPPRLAVVEAVEAVAGGDARLAAGAGVEVDLERVLLARARAHQREEVAVGPGRGRTSTARRARRRAGARTGRPRSAPAARGGTGRRASSRSVTASGRSCAGAQAAGRSGRRPRGPRRGPWPAPDPSGGARRRRPGRRRSSVTSSVEKLLAGSTSQRLITVATTAAPAMTRKNVRGDTNRKVGEEDDARRCCRRPRPAPRSAR